MSMEAIFFKKKSQVFAAFSAIFLRVMMRILFPKLFICQELKQKPSAFK
jgi:hypothetical protein